MQRRLPPDIANLLAIAIRNTNWYRPKVANFLKSCELPPAVFREALKMQRDEVPTVKIIPHILDELEKFGDSGWLAARRMLTKMYQWKDLHSLPPDKRSQAAESLQELRKAYDEYVRELEYQDRKEQEERERRMQQQRTERVRMSEVDHEKLQHFRDRFDEIHSLADEQTRGTEFEKLMNEVFGYYSERSAGSFKRVGEQIDGLFYFDKHIYFVEIRWKKKKASAADISVLRDRAISGFGGDTKALFISFEGFSPDCLESLEGRTDERVILMDGADLRLVLDCQMGFDVLLSEKQLDLARTKKPYTSGYNILAHKRS